ncbi:MAG: hypothetical protein AAB436_01520 [Patescibacteria group bacterium]
MDKRKAHHYYAKVRFIKPWYFLALALLSGIVCVFALRANNQHMIELRDAVYTADKDGSDVNKPLRELQAYVTTHMNTDLNSSGSTVYPPIQLKYTYERLQKAQKDQAGLTGEQIYTAAQAYCEQQNSHDVSGRNRIPCIEQYVQTHTVPKGATIPDALYKFAFVAPSWSPDLAGWSMIIGILGTLLFVVSFVLSRLLRH